MTGEFFVKMLRVLLLSFGCALLPCPLARADLGADAAFAHLAEGYLTGYLAWRPQTGTALGLHEYDGKLTSFSQASIEAEHQRLKTFSRRLGRIHPTRLSSRARQDFHLLRAAVERELFSFEDMQVYRLNPMTYAGALDVNIYIKRDFAPLKERVRSLIAVLNEAPKVMAAARVNLAASLPRPQVETAIDQAKGATEFLSKDLVEALRGLDDGPLMAEFSEANNRAIRELRGFARFLQEERLPGANNNYALGRRKYAKLLWCGEMVTSTPEALLELGWNELRRKQQLFAQAARLIDPAQTPVAVFQAIQKEHPTEASLLPDTAKDLEMIRQFVVDHRLVTLPSPVRARVAPTPQYLRATSFASMDTPGPFETRATEAYYYVTPTEPNWTSSQKEEWLTAFNYYTTDIVSIHEAYPGHYVQFLCLNASQATRLEKVFNSYAFTEGWAHYAEEMLMEAGFGGSGSPSPTVAEKARAAKYLLAQTDEALLRLCRLCVSVKMHCQGMSVEEATRFFQENCYYEEKTAHQEAIRGAFDPEYLYYSLGKLELLKLRADYRKQEGAGFTLQKFHDELLSHGAPPIRILRELMLKDRRLWRETL